MNQLNTQLIKDFSEAEKLSKEKKYEESIKKYEMILEKYPSDGTHEVFYNLTTYEIF